MTATLISPRAKVQSSATQPRIRRRPHVVVLGSESGGSGKSTTAAHLIVALLKRGFRIGSIDLDARQGTLSRFLDNRVGYAERAGLPLELPEHRRVYLSESSLRDVAETEEKQAFERSLEEIADRDYIVIDTPGSDSFLVRAGHACAEVLITPINDSFLDLDLLARIDPEGRQILDSSRYSQMVWEQRQHQEVASLPSTDWIVMRNRLSHSDPRNEREIDLRLELMSQHVQFRLAPGFSERVIFRELFSKGLTLLDLRDNGAEFKLDMSHVAARQEVRALLRSLSLPSDRKSVSKEVQFACGNAIPVSRSLDQLVLPGVSAKGEDEGNS